MNRPKGDTMTKRGATYKCTVCGEDFQLTNPGAKLNAAMFGAVCPQCAETIRQWEIAHGHA